MQQADASALVPAHVEHDAPALGRDHAQRRVQLRAAVAAQRAEHVAGQAFGVHPDQQVLAVADLAVDQGDVLDAIQQAVVADRAEGAVRGRDARLGDPLDLALGAPPVGDQVGDGDHREVVVGREDLQFLAAGHVAVVLLADQLAQHAGRGETGQSGQVDGGLGVTGAAQHAAFPGTQRHHVAGAGEVGRHGLGSASRRMVCARSVAEMPVLTPCAASTVTVYAVPRRSWLVWYIGGRSSRSHTLSGSGTQM